MIFGESGADLPLVLWTNRTGVVLFQYMRIYLCGGYFTVTLLGISHLASAV